MKNLIKKNITGSDLITLLFLAVTIPHSAQILMNFENSDWKILAWFLSSALDIGIAYGAFVSSNKDIDEEARRLATILFAGLSLGSYGLNVTHYFEYNANCWSFALGAFFPIGILLLAKIKGRLAIAPAPAIQNAPEEAQNNNEDAPANEEIGKQEEAEILQLPSGIVFSTEELHELLRKVQRRELGVKDAMSAYTGVQP